MACTNSEKEAAIKMFDDRANDIESKMSFITDGNPGASPKELGEIMLRNTEQFDKLNDFGSKIMSKCGISENELYGKIDPDLQLAIYEASGKSIKEVPFFSGKATAYAMAAVDHVASYTSEVAKTMKVLLPDAANYTISKTTETAVSTGDDTIPYLATALGLSVAGLAVVSRKCKNLFHRYDK